MTKAEIRERITVRSDIADLDAYRAPQLDAPVKLNTNESPYPPPLEFMEDVASRIAKSALHRYPNRDATELRERLGAFAGALTDHVWVGNGSNEVLLQILLAYGGSERKAMTFEPTYSLHSQITRVSGTRLLRARRNPDFSMHVEASVDAITTQAPDIVFLCSPNNPTGNVSTEEEISEICRAAPGLVVLDEAYYEFSDLNLVRLTSDFDNLIVTRSFSKAWRLAGARLGYMVAQPWVIEEIQRVRMPYHLSAPTQIIGLAALDHSAELLSTIETIKHERDRLFRELSTTSGITAFPSGGNFVFFRCDTTEATGVWQKLLDDGILVRDFTHLPHCEEHLRVSVGTPEQDERFLDSLSKALTQ